MLDWVYTEKVKEHFLNPKNVWRDEENFTPDGIGEVGSLACGDQMRVGIKVKNNKITDIRWKTYGCASAVASTSMMSCMAIGMKLEEAYNLTPQKITDALGGLPEHKFHCSVLGDRALRAAIDDYLEKNGLDNPYKDSIAKIVCECKGVTDVQIEELVASKKARTFEDLVKITGLGTGCGKCRAKAEEIFLEAKHINGV